MSGTHKAAMRMPTDPRRASLRRGDPKMPYQPAALPPPVPRKR